MVVGLAFLFAFLIAGLIGSKRQIGFWWSFAACLFLSPVIGLIITVCSDKLPAEEENPDVQEEEKPLAEVLAASNSSDNNTVSASPQKEDAPIKNTTDPTIIDY